MMTQEDGIKVNFRHNKCYFSQSLPATHMNLVDYLVPMGTTLVTPALIYTTHHLSQSWRTNDNPFSVNQCKQ